MKNKVWTLVSVIVVASMVLMACAPKATPTPTPKPKPTAVPPTPVPTMKITVATDATWPPFEYVDETTKEFAGFDIDLMKAIAAAAGFEVEFVNVAWDPLLAGMATGEYDAAISAMTITEERAKQWDFSDPYYVAGQLIAVGIGDDAIKAAADLAGKVVGAQIGTTGAMEVENIAGATLRTYDDIAQAFLDLINGQIDAVLADNPLVEGYVAKYSDELKTVGDLLSSEEYGIAVKKDAAEILAAINEGLAAVKAQGLLEELQYKWVTEEPAAQIKVGLVTDVGKVNDGTFNEFAYKGMMQAVDEFGLESAFIETLAPTDYEKNIEQFANEGYDMIVTVGFLIGDATAKLAKAYPDIQFAGVDQFQAEEIENSAGLIFSEDQSGFLAGCLAGLMTESNVVGIVAGMEIPPVVKFREGYQNGVAHVNPDATVLGVYIDSFTDPARGKEAALSQMAEGADVIFGAGGPTGSGGIMGAAAQGAWVIGVDQDEYLTTFGNGSVTGADKLLSSAMKRVDVAVYTAIKNAVTDAWLGGNVLLEAANDGVGLAPFHDTEGAVPQAVKDKLAEIAQGMKAGTIGTGVGEEPAAKELRVGLVTDVGKVNDGTFNEFAYKGMMQAVDEFGLESAFIETLAPTDYEKNIEQFANEGYDMIVTVGFLIGDATAKLAKAYPDIQFAGVDQFQAEEIENSAGLIFSEDQSGFLAGCLAGLMTESNVVGIVAGMEIPPVVKFREGYQNGVAHVNPDATVLGVYIDSFTDPARGKEAALSQMAEGADVIFGAGGPTGSGGIMGAAAQGAWVIGVDQDEYLTTFGNGSVTGADKLLSSAMKRVDVAVYTAIKNAVTDAWLGGNVLLEAANDGVGLAPFHDTEGAVPQAVKDKLAEIAQGMKAGTIGTGVEV